MKFVNKWNLPILTLISTVLLTALAVFVVFILRLLGLTSIDIIAVTIPLGVVVPIVFVWGIGLFIYSKVTHTSFSDTVSTDYSTTIESDDGWE